MLKDALHSWVFAPGITHRRSRETLEICVTELFKHDFSHLWRASLKANATRTHGHARHEQRRIQKCDNWKLCKCWKTRCILEHSRLISPTAGEVAKHLSYLLCVAELFKHGFCFSPATSIVASERHTHARTRTPWAKTNSKNATIYPLGDRLSKWNFWIWIFHALIGFQ